ncbi:MAG: hypothetical protein A2301_01735 [Candidatus Magasanikbacteria bacterium RIFOXYB2_FULL_40_13]|uniref:Uncharacterized protein n=3 Tax=Candidatus Magasanikiibacteriota TaxID=1752731 RepID=A0A1F6NK61_9BACT|nr:MAG: hypothetical protein A2373_02800 [Candidatus Magasanikbacteria bacterium RIFOXYB1_FULL_40_15]OGH86772.1 MAG: hypothetical protein A2301_01735 [Candidatus Magasanikbacteria bacterium RIFOXYB2_FULL_40_13]
MGRRPSKLKEKMQAAEIRIKAREKYFKEVRYFLTIRCEKIHRLPKSPTKKLFADTAKLLKKQITKDTGYSLRNGKYPPDETILSQKAKALYSLLKEIRMELFKPKDADDTAST